MNRLFMAMCVLLLSAQFNLLSAQTAIMKIWKGGDVTATYQTTDVDSVTFGTNSGGEIIPDGNPSIISFSVKSSTPMTRAAQTGSDEAAKINNEFIVWGEKEETDATTADANIVFKNYRVQYNGNAGKTASNTNGWEYVGIVPYTSYVTPTEGTQSVKYWDFGKTYTFTAVSALSSDITTGKVKITKNYTDASKMAHGYDIELYKGADASAIYVADRKEVSYDIASVSPVEMEFSNIQSKIRFGFYETVPGYNVKITKVAYGNTTSETSNKFGVTGNFVQVPTGTGDTDILTYTVTYDAKNIPVVSITTTSTATKGYEEFGNNIFSANIGKSSLESDVTYDQSSKEYTSILPNTSNETPMTFTVSYDLISEDTGEKIAVADRQVTVPAAYCQWKPNYAYTYLFKISDKSADLYPITFDACVVTEETGNQETITEVSEPSITTFATTSSTDKTIVKSTVQNEYAASNVIYATVLDGSSIATLTTSGTDKCINLYTVTTTDASKCPISEASVANAIKNSTATSGPIKYETVTIKDSGDDLPILTNEVPTEDGSKITLTSGEVLKWTAETGKTYAIEYIKDANTKYYKIVKIASGN